MKKALMSFILVVALLVVSNVESQAQIFTVRYSVGAVKMVKSFYTYISTHEWHDRFWYIRQQIESKRGVYTSDGVTPLTEFEYLRLISGNFEVVSVGEIPIPNETPEEEESPEIPPQGGN